MNGRDVGSVALWMLIQHASLWCPVAAMGQERSPATWPAVGAAPSDRTYELARVIEMVAWALRNDPALIAGMEVTVGGQLRGGDPTMACSFAPCRQIVHLLGETWPPGTEERLAIRVAAADDGGEFRKLIDDKCSNGHVCWAMVSGELRHDRSAGAPATSASEYGSFYLDARHIEAWQGAKWPEDVPIIIHSKEYDDWLRHSWVRIYSSVP